MKIVEILENHGNSGKSWKFSKTYRKSRKPLETPYLRSKHPNPALRQKSSFSRAQLPGSNFLRISNARISFQRDPWLVLVCPGLEKTCLFFGLFLVLVCFLIFLLLFVLFLLFCFFFLCVSGGVPWGLGISSDSVFVIECSKYLVLSCVLPEAFWDVL